MTLDELIAWVSEQATDRAKEANVFGAYMRDHTAALGEWMVAEMNGLREEAATLTSVENALRRLAQIESAEQ